MLYIQSDAEYSMLLAVPCGPNHVEMVTQTHNLRTCFIQYLQQKEAAGIVNITPAEATQVCGTFYLPTSPLPLSPSLLLLPQPSLLSLLLLISFTCYPQFISGYLK